MKYFEHLDNCRFVVFAEICRISRFRQDFSVKQAGERLKFEHPEHRIVYEDPQILQ